MTNEALLKERAAFEAGLLETEVKTPPQLNVEENNELYGNVLIAVTKTIKHIKVPLTASREDICDILRDTYVVGSDQPLVLLLPAGAPDDAYYMLQRVNTPNPTLQQILHRDAAKHMTANMVRKAFGKC